MILSSGMIKKAIDMNDITITPFKEEQLGPNSYDLRLYNELLVYKDHTLDMKRNNQTERIIIPEDGYRLQPGRLYLARTVEWVASDLYAPMLEGRSSVGRLGLYVHITAGFANVGSSGYWTLELSCVQPLIIYPNVSMCQVFFMTVQGSQIPLKQTMKYKDAKTIQPSKLWQEF